MQESDCPQLEQLFCVPLSWKEFQGEEDARAFALKAVESGVGGIILYGGDSDATPRILAEIQSGLDTPLLVMADIETGTAQQIPGGTEFPGMMALGAIGSSRLAYEVGRATALEAREVGVNVVLAPVLDINTNALNPIVNIRSFGDDSDLVADLGTAYIGGCQGAGAIATAKHFPGHGDTDVDSHISLPVVRRGPVSVRKLELSPFARAIEEEVMAVMVGHIAIPSITGSESIPASLSREVVTSLLRDELGYDGLVMSDAMIMGGIGKDFSEAEAVVQALRAGVDMILYVSDLQEAVNAVKIAITNGSLDRVVVDRAIARIASVRNHLQHIPTGVGERGGAAEPPGHRALAKDVADQSATLVRNRDGFFPLSPTEEGLFIILEDDRQDAEIPLTSLLKKVFPSWGLLHLESNGVELADSQIEEVRGASRVVLFLFSPVRAWRGVADLSPEGRRSADIVLRQADSSAVVSFGSPYMLRYFAWIDAYLCLYSPSAVSQDSAVRVLRGALKPSGKLPVNIPGLYPSGWRSSRIDHREDNR